MTENLSAIPDAEARIEPEKATAPADQNLN
jgi:hypothetical protein